MIELYTQPNCGPCIQAKRWLEKNEVEFVVRDVTTDNEALNTILDLGYGGTPVFKNGDQHFSGFNIAQVRELI